MNRKILGSVLAVLALALPMLDNLAPKPAPTPNPAPAPGPSPIPAVEVPASVVKPLTDGFAGSKQEAGEWAGLLYGMARTIETDKSHPKGARLKTMLDIQNLRDWIVACPPKPIGKGDIIGQAIGPELAKLGTSDEALEEAGRREAVVTLLTGAAQTLEGLSK